MSFTGELWIEVKTGSPERAAGLSGGATRPLTKASTAGSIRYTERLADAGVVDSVGSKGGSFVNALAETVNGHHKAELIRRRGPWRSVEDVELTTSRWVHWWDTQRLHSACGDVPPAEYEAACWAPQKVAAAA